MAEILPECNSYSTKEGSELTDIISRSIFSPNSTISSAKLYPRVITDDSKDPRIAQHGRFTSINMIFRESLVCLDEEHFRTYIESFLEIWVDDWLKLPLEKRNDPKILQELSKDLRKTSLEAMDLERHEEREMGELKQLIINLMKENDLLKAKIKELEEAHDKKIKKNY